MDGPYNQYGFIFQSKKRYGPIEGLLIVASRHMKRIPSAEAVSNGVIHAA
jgi:hypothetical protein